MDIYRQPNRTKCYFWAFYKHTNACNAQVNYFLQITHASRNQYLTVCIIIQPTCILPRHPNLDSCKVCFTQFTYTQKSVCDKTPPRQTSQNSWKPHEVQAPHLTYAVGLVYHLSSTLLRMKHCVCVSLSKISTRSVGNSYLIVRCIVICNALITKCTYPTPNFKIQGGPKSKPLPNDQKIVLNRI